MAFATSDVAITETHIRKTVTFHCLAAFAFNIGVLAFTINLLASRLGGHVDLRRHRHFPTRRNQAAADDQNGPRQSVE